MRARVRASRTISARRTILAFASVGTNAALGAWRAITPLRAICALLRSVASLRPLRPRWTAVAHALLWFFRYPRLTLIRNRARGRSRRTDNGRSCGRRRRARSAHQLKTHARRSRIHAKHSGAGFFQHFHDNLSRTHTKLRQSLGDGILNVIACDLNRTF
jgi:hypothetical protein